MTGERIGERGAICARSERLERDLHALPIRALERQLRWPDAVHDAEAIEHLGNKQVVECKRSEAGRVVVGCERTDTVEDVRDRHAGDRNELGADQPEVPGLVHDEDAVAELVEPQRVGV